MSLLEIINKSKPKENLKLDDFIRRISNGGILKKNFDISVKKLTKKDRDYVRKITKEISRDVNGKVVTLIVLKDFDDEDMDDAFNELSQKDNTKISGINKSLTQNEYDEITEGIYDFYNTIGDSEVKATRENNFNIWKKETQSKLESTTFSINPSVRKQQLLSLRRILIIEWIQFNIVSLFNFYKYDKDKLDEINEDIRQAFYDNFVRAQNPSEEEINDIVSDYLMYVDYDVDEDEERILTDDEINDIVGGISKEYEYYTQGNMDDPIFVELRGEDAIVNASIYQIQKDIADDLMKIKIRPSLIPELKQRIIEKYAKSLIVPGVSVGIIAANSLGERWTQSNLNVQRLTGVSSVRAAAKSVDIINEVLDIRSPKNPITTIYFSKKQTYQSLRNNKMKIQHTTISDVINTTKTAVYHRDDIMDEEWHEIHERIYGNPKNIPKSQYLIRIVVNQREMYSRRLKMKDIADAIEDSDSGNTLRAVFSPFHIGIIDVYTPEDIAKIDMDTKETKRNIPYITDENYLRHYLSNVVKPLIESRLISGIEGIQQTWTMFVEMDKCISNIEKRQLKTKKGKKHYIHCDLDLEIIQNHGIDLDELVKFVLYKLPTELAHVVRIDYIYSDDDSEFPTAMKILDYPNDINGDVIKSIINYIKERKVHNLNSVIDRINEKKRKNSLTIHLKNTYSFGNEDDYYTLPESYDGIDILYSLNNFDANMRVKYYQKYLGGEIDITFEDSEKYEQFMRAIDSGYLKVKPKVNDVCIHWFLETHGNNVRDLSTLTSIDLDLTYSNDILENYSLYGIESAWNLMYRKLSSTSKIDDDVSSQHLILLIDFMCHLGYPASIGRHTLSNYEVGPLAMIGFEEIKENIFSSAAHGKIDGLMGNVGSSFIGNLMNIGTETADADLDVEKKYEYLSELEKQRGEEDII